MRHLILVVLLFAFPGFHSLRASQANVDEIMTKVYQAAALQTTAPDSALRLSRVIIIESKKIAYKKGEAYGYMRIGSLFHLKGQSDSALHYVQAAAAIRKNLADVGGMASAQSLMGYIYKKDGRIDSAMASFYRAIPLFRENRDTSALIETQLDIGHLYNDQNDFDAAKQAYDTAFKWVNASKKTISLAYVYEAYGKYHWHVENYTEALSNYLTAAEWFVAHNKTGHLGRIKNNIALCYDQLNKAELAISFYKESLTAYAQNDFKHEMATVQYNIGINYYNLSQFDSSIFYLNQSRDIAETIRARSRLTKVYKTLAAIYNTQQQHDSAYHYQLSFSQLQDSLLNEEKVTSMAAMRVKFETQQKEKEIELLNAQNRNKAAQQKALLLLIVVLLLVLFIVLFLYRQRKRLAKKNAQITSQKINSLLSEQEKKTYNAMLEGREEERTRIASDLHDRLGSMLSTVKLLFSSFHKKLDTIEIDHKQQYDKATSLLDEVYLEVRRISHNLGTGMVSKFGLRKALDELCDSINHSGSIHCQYSTYGLENNSLPLDMEIGIYRMVQEALNNALKYAQAQHIQIQMNQIDHTLNVMVEDDGVGFDLKILKQKNGMGFKNMQKRAQGLNGKVHIDSMPNKGCTVIIELPIPEKS